jgi:hypothetical protein
MVSVRFYGDREAAGVDSVYENLIKLQERFAAREDDKPAIRLSIPSAQNGLGELFRKLKATATDPVSPHEIRVAEPANGRCAVLFVTTPKIAARKTAEYCCAASLRSLTLKRLKDFFDCVTHYLSVIPPINRGNQTAPF